VNSVKMLGKGKSGTPSNGGGDNSGKSNKY
jgi:hypothetical protein